MDIETLRADCPGYRSCTYLNTGASGPSPRHVVDAVCAFERHHQFDAPCEEGPYTAASDTLSTVRETVASFIGADAGQIAFTRNTVEGITHIAGAIDWEPGDVVVRTDLEHPAGALPWEQLRRRHGVEVREIATENGRLDRETLAACLDGARLVCLSSLTWNYGTRLPVTEIVEMAHDAGVKVLVDAVQSVGHHSVDVEAWGADFVALSGHKWLLGPWGAGVLYVADPDTLEPGQIGYFSVQTDDEYGLDVEDYRFHPDARRFELGTTAISPYVGLQTAIETFEAIGMRRVEARIERLTARLREGLGDRLVSPPDARSGLVTFEADDPQGLVERLKQQNIHIRWLPDPYACRVSVHAVNTDAEIDQLLDAL